MLQWTDAPTNTDGVTNISYYDFVTYQAYVDSIISKLKYITLDTNNNRYLITSNTDVAARLTANSFTCSGYASVRLLLIPDANSSFNFVESKVSGDNTTLEFKCSLGSVFAKFWDYQEGIFVCSRIAATGWSDPDVHSLSVDGGMITDTIEADTLTATNGTITTLTATTGTITTGTMTTGNIGTVNSISSSSSSYKAIFQYDNIQMTKPTTLTGDSTYFREVNNNGDLITGKTQLKNTDTDPATIQVSLTVANGNNDQGRTFIPTQEVFVTPAYIKSHNNTRRNLVSNPYEAAVAYDTYAGFDFQNNMISTVRMQPIYSTGWVLVASNKRYNYTITGSQILQYVPGMSGDIYPNNTFNLGSIVSGVTGDTCKPFPTARIYATNGTTTPNSWTSTTITEIPYAMRSTSNAFASGVFFAWTSPSTFSIHTGTSYIYVGFDFTNGISATTSNTMIITSCYICINIMP